MLKRIYRLCGISIIVFGTFFFMACDGQTIVSQTTATQQAVITELNQPYENSIVRVTITDLKTCKDESWEDDEIEINADFIIENMSKKDISLGKSYMMTYVDDFLVVKTSPPATLAPGKKVKFTQTAYILKDAKRIEYHFYDPDSSDHIATFIFDVPPIGEAE